MSDVYTYKIRFTNSSFMPWEWSVYLNGRLLTDRAMGASTGSAHTAWGARWQARKFIRKHRRFRGITWEFTYDR